jgi:hypothetical protein
MQKVINPLTKKTYGGRSYRVFVNIQYNDGKLSITGVEGPTLGGNALGSCGQIVDGLLEDVSKFLPGWNRAKVKKLQEVWERWHLNDMNAGVKEQEDFLREWKKTNKYEYTAACDALKEAGLYEVNGYKYGHGWIKEDVPQEVIEWLFSLPDSEVKPAWI